MRRRSFIKTIVKYLVALSSIFLFPKKVVAWFAAGGGESFLITTRIKSKPQEQGRVVVADYSPFFQSDQHPDKKVVGKLLDGGIKRLTGIEKPESGWASLFEPSDIVGLKVNTLAGKMLSPQVPVVLAVIDKLKAAGVKDGNIIIWDRTSRELERAGFPVNINGNGFKCFGTDVARYEYEPEVSGSVASCFSTIISRTCTAIINIGVLKDHDLAGVSIGMKNLYGAIHNPNKYHDNNCDPYVADLNNHPYIRYKVRLVICDGIRGQYNGGPAFKPQWAWNANVLLMSRDPVALDRVGYELIEQKRKEEKMPPLKAVGREPKWIETAARLGLGEAAMEKIEVLKV